MQNIFDFIATQPEILVNKIYGSSDTDNVYSPWACKAIFSSLSALSKNYVFRCLSIHEPLNTSDLEKWVKPERRHLHSKAINELIKLRILIELHADDLTKPRLQMNSFFRRGFQYTLCNPIEPWSKTAASISLKPDRKAPTKEELNDFCMEKWNDVLKCLLNVQPQSLEGDSTIENFLKCTGLIVENSKRTHEITSEGYEYMLKDHQSQVAVLSIIFVFLLEFFFLLE
jgi:transcription initiation factor TFIIH subunit 4